MRVRVHVVEQRKEVRPYHNSKFACGARLYQALQLEERRQGARTEANKMKVNDEWQTRQTRRTRRTRQTAVATLSLYPSRPGSYVWEGGEGFRGERRVKK